MEFQVKNNIFSKFVGLIRTINDEARINIESDSINCILVDPAHVALANVNLKDGYEFFDKGEIMENAKGGKLNFEYEDVGHPPLHPMCRCTVIPVTEGF